MINLGYDRYSKIKNQGILLKNKFYEFIDEEFNEFREYNAC